MVTPNGSQRSAHTGMANTLLVLAVAVGGCGDDGGAPAQGPVSPKPTAAASLSAAAGKPGTKLPEKLHIEDRVSCSIPDKPTDPKDGKCDPKAPSCAEHFYCLQLQQGTYCEKCPERDGIRHVFKDRDFAVEQNRDPFQSFLLMPFIRPTDTVKIDVTKRCMRDDQMVASSYSYADLKLVGIVAQGTQRKVLMTVSREGYIIKRGDCVGKEKAVVKDIGTGYITFVVDPDTAAASQRTPEEYSVQLNPKQLAVNQPTELPTPAPRTVIAPAVAPPAVLPPAPAPTRPATAGSGSAVAPAAGSGSAVAPPAEAPPAAVPKKP